MSSSLLTLFGASLVTGSGVVVATNSATKLYNHTSSGPWNKVWLGLGLLSTGIGGFISVQTLYKLYNKRKNKNNFTQIVETTPSDVPTDRTADVIKDETSYGETDDETDETINTGLRTGGLLGSGLLGQVEFDKPEDQSRLSPMKQALLDSQQELLELQRRSEATKN